MARQRPSRLLLLAIVPFTLLVFSARSAWTQEIPSASNTPTQLSSRAGQFVAVPEAKMRFHPMYENLLLPFAPKQGQIPSLVRFRTLDMGYHLPFTKNNALSNLWPLSKTDELQARANRFTRNTPVEWLDVNTKSKVHFSTPAPGADVGYYGHGIPWAGRVILGVGEKAKAHPQVISVLKLIDPQDLRFENRLPRGSASNIHAIGRGQHANSVAT